jgi:hypothetical protein
LIAGQEYEFTAAGKWVDWFVTCDADGFTSDNWVLRFAEWQRRVPQKNRFALIGALNFDKKSTF